MLPALLAAGGLWTVGSAVVSAAATSYASGSAINAQSQTTIQNIESSSEVDQSKARATTAINMAKNSADTLDYAEVRS